MSQIVIKFDRENPVYRPGELVSGKAIIMLDEPLSIPEVKISFIGEARVSWTRMETNQRVYFGEDVISSKTLVFSNEETIFNKTTTVWPDDGPIRNSSPAMPGKKEFSFWFPIPEETPTGLPLLGNFYFHKNNDYGYIRYLLEVRMVRPMFIDDQTLRQSVPIEEVCDLNTNPKASLPIAIVDGKTFGSWCCASGRIDVSINLLKTGYAIGEHIAVTAEIENRSRRTIEKVRLKLIQVCTFRSRHGYSADVEDSVIASVAKVERVIPGRMQRWENEGFSIPSSAKTSMEANSIIKFSHYLVMEVVWIRWCSTNLEIRIPILIGTIPLKAPAPSPRSSVKSERKSIK